MFDIYEDQTIPQARRDVIRHAVAVAFRYDHDVDEWLAESGFTSSEERLFALGVLYGIGAGIELGSEEGEY